MHIRFRRENVTAIEKVG